MSNRFDSVEYDSGALAESMVAKRQCQTLEKVIILQGDGIYQDRAMQSLEECLMWINKAIRDNQMVRNNRKAIK